MVEIVCHISLDCPDNVTTIDSTPTRILYEAAACVIEDTVYAVGIGDECNQLWKWNKASDWRKCPDMVLGRRRQGVAVVNYTLYALGGVDVEGKSLNSVESYNTQTWKWLAAGQLPHAVSSIACVTYKNSVYVFGGINEHNHAVNDTFKYHPTSKRVAFQSRMPQASRKLRAVLYKSFAILFGKSCFVYSLDSDAWYERKHFESAMSYCGVVLVHDTIFIAGGGTAKQNEDNKQVWTCTDQVLSVSVRDVIEDKEGVVWKHHATLPKAALIHAYCLVSQ